MSRIPATTCGHAAMNTLLEDWLIIVVKEYPKRLGGWTILFCCPPSIWLALNCLNDGFRTRILTLLPAADGTKECPRDAPGRE